MGVDLEQSRLRGYAGPRTQNRAYLYDPWLLPAHRTSWWRLKTSAPWGGRIGPDGKEPAAGHGRLETGRAELRGAGAGRRWRSGLLFAHVDATHEERCAAFLRDSCRNPCRPLERSRRTRAGNMSGRWRPASKPGCGHSELSTLDAVEAGLGGAALPDDCASPTARGWLLCAPEARRAVFVLSERSRGSGRRGGRPRRAAGAGSGRGGRLRVDDHRDLPAARRHAGPEVRRQLCKRCCCASPTAMSRASRSAGRPSSLMDKADRWLSRLPWTEFFRPRSAVRHKTRPRRRSPETLPGSCGTASRRMVDGNGQRL